MPVLLPLVCGNAAFALDVERGRGLYENHCTGCHESTVHVRQRHHASNPGELYTWVQRWAMQLDLGWGQEELEDVSAFLDGRYYHFSTSP
jgi:hypothetical protein